MSHRERLTLDASYGEGGGQILRTALTLSVLTGKPFEAVNIRAGRPKPGLAAQHVTAAEAAAAVCGARLDGAELGSSMIFFEPGPARAGDYRFDVALARGGASAGSTSLVAQTVLLPLALSPGASEVDLAGGTHVPWSPPFDHLALVWLPVLERMGLEARASLRRWGFYPAGGGLVSLAIRGRGGPLEPLQLARRGPLREVVGRAATARLPKHVSARMARAARRSLAAAGIVAHIEEIQVPADCPGAGIFLGARYEKGLGGASALGKRGRPAERVGEEAAAKLLAFHRSAATVDDHLADQLLVPASLASGPSFYLSAQRSGHLETNAWTIERFGLAQVSLEGGAHQTLQVTVRPRQD